MDISLKKYISFSSLFLLFSYYIIMTLEIINKTNGHPTITNGNSAGFWFSGIGILIACSRFTKNNKRFFQPKEIKTFSRWATFWHTLILSLIDIGGYGTILYFKLALTAEEQNAVIKLSNSHNMIKLMQDTYQNFLSSFATQIFLNFLVAYISIKLAIYYKKRQFDKKNNKPNSTAT
jgi:hypothetical protein